MVMVNKSFKMEILMKDIGNRIKSVNKVNTFLIKLVRFWKAYLKMMNLLMDNGTLRRTFSLKEILNNHNH